MPIEKAPGTDLTYYLIAFDKEGRERTTDPDGGILSARLMADLGAGVATDIFLISHGWKADIPATRDQNDKWIGAMACCSDDVARIRSVCPAFRPLIVGLHWPSLPFGDEEFGPGAAAGPAAPSLDDLVGIYADRIADTEASRAALRTIFESAADRSDPESLPLRVVEAYRVLDRESGMGGVGVGGPPAADCEPFDPEASYRNARNSETPGPEGFAGFSPGGLLGPLQQLSFWQMKRRGNRFGETGGRSLLDRIRERAPRVRVHLMGHSFGCIVVSSIIAGPGGRVPVPRPVDTLFLAQGALSLWSYCSRIDLAGGAPGYFHSIIGEHKVAGALLATTSSFDTAVGRFYPFAAGAARQVSLAVGELPRYGAIGAFGVQGPGTGANPLAMKPATQGYGFRRRGVYNLVGDRYICRGSGTSGAHADIAHPEVAHAYWEGVLASIR